MRRIFASNPIKWPYIKCVHFLVAYIFYTLQKFFFFSSDFSDIPYISEANSSRRPVSYHRPSGHEPSPAGTELSSALCATQRFPPPGYKQKHARVLRTIPHSLV